MVLIVYPLSLIGDDPLPVDIGRVSLTEANGSVFRMMEDFDGCLTDGYGTGLCLR